MLKVERRLWAPVLCNWINLGVMPVLSLRLDTSLFKLGTALAGCCYLSKSSLTFLIMHFESGLQSPVGPRSVRLRRKLASGGMA